MERWIGADGEDDPSKPFIQGRLSWHQSVLWLYYSQVEPFGEQRDDVRMGISTSNIINNIRACAPFRSGRVKMTKPGDFIPDYDKGEKIVRQRTQKAGRGEGRKQEAAKESWNRFESQLEMIGKAMREGKARLG